jgi:hypothetical protein
VYKGCNPDEADAAKGFNGVHYAMEFYPADTRAKIHLHQIFQLLIISVKPMTLTKKHII